VGFNAISKPATGGTPEAAGLTALLAKARADGASTGDVYKDTTSGTAFVYNSAGSGILLPTGWADKVGNLKTQDTGAPSNGPCYITIADATSDLTGRGWQLVGTTKTADAAMEISDPGSGPGYCIAGANFAFTTSDALYAIGRVKSVTAGSGTYYQSRCPGIYNGTKDVIFSYGAATLGVVESADAGGGIQSTSASTLTTGTAEAWLQWHYPAAEGAAIGSSVIDGSLFCTQTYAGMMTGGMAPTQRIDLMSSGGTEVFEVFEFFVFEVS